MAGSNHLGHAYPFVFHRAASLPSDQAIADIEIVVFLSGFDPTTHKFQVTSVTQGFMSLTCDHPDIEDVLVPLGDNAWTSIEDDAVRVRVLAGPYAARVTDWQGEAVIEPCRVILLPGARQVVEVYNAQRIRMPPKAGCRDYVFEADNTFVEGVDGQEGFEADDYALPSYVLACTFDSGDVTLAGGYSSRVSQYDAQEQLQISGDPEGGELGRPCTGQAPTDFDDVPPYGRNTLDGGSRCVDVLRSINGISTEAFQFLAGLGVSVYSQPEKSRVTVRFDGAGSTACPFPEITQADCPPRDDLYCGEIDPIDLCPSPPEELGSLRDPNTIPPIDDLVVVRPNECDPLPSNLKYLGLRGCSTAAVRFTGSEWVFARRCQPNCFTELPTDVGTVNQIRTIQCIATPPDSTTGVRNPEFTDFANWGLLQVPAVVDSYPGFDNADMPAVSLIASQGVYQTEIYVPHRSVLTFKYFGKIRLVIATLGRLCVDEQLDSNGHVVTYLSTFAIAANQPIAVLFQVDNASDISVVSTPHLTAV